MLEGHLLSERYRIKRTIGGGGMANVYLAFDIILEREVAIKVLRPEFANDPEFIERFDREAQAATSLSHPNIVNIYDVGEENNILYMVMEYVSGWTLKEYIHEKGALDVTEAIEIMKQLTDAIAHAHLNGLIHRDIKPQNVLMDDYGNVKVTDFGIAIALSATSLTQTNSILGSVHYLSPEQARGGMATKKSDIYSLGIVFYELLTGKLPFSGQSPISIALKHLQNDTPSVRKINEAIPQSVENIVIKATSKDSFHRYESVFAMEQALNIALDPSHINEAIYVPPQEAGEETKAIPIIHEDKLQELGDQSETLIHNETITTKKMPTDPSTNQADSSKKQKKAAKPKKRFYKKKRFYLVLLLLLIISAAVIYYLVNTPKDVIIPELDNMTYEEAKEKLEQLNVKVEKELVTSDEIEEDKVVKTSPEVGRKIKEYETVTVYVSNGKAKIAIEDYVGQNYNQVKRILEDADYKEIIAYPKTSDAPVGEILTQIQPPGGEEVVPSETKVIFEISDGPKMISLNRLEGLTLEDAKAYAEKHGLRLNVSEDYSDSVEEGRIIRQSPDANNEVEIGSEIKIVISQGPKEIPPKSYNVSFTVPYEPSNTNENDADATDEEAENKKQQKQTVKIYIDDVENNLDEVYLEEEITEDSEYTLTLLIAPDSKGTYKVVRDDDVILEKSVDYKDGE